MGKKGGKCGQQENDKVAYVWLEVSKERDGKVAFQWEYVSHLLWEIETHVRHEKPTFPWAGNSFPKNALNLVKLLRV